jgi:photosystem II stability/assembly factor-like uncharacterized protein
MPKLVSFLFLFLGTSFQVYTQWNSLVETPFGGTLYSVHFINSTAGWISSNTEKILKTTDGGESWREISTGIDGGFLSIFFVDS